MTKKNTSIWIEPRVQEKLRVLSKKWGKSVGDIIDGLTRFADRAESPEKYIEDPTTCKRIKASFETCMANAGSRAKWEAAHVEELIQNFKNLRDLATQAGDGATAARATAKIEALEEEYGLIEED